MGVSYPPDAKRGGIKSQALQWTLLRGRLLGRQATLEDSLPSQMTQHSPLSVIFGIIMERMGDGKIFP